MNCFLENKVRLVQKLDIGREDHQLGKKVKETYVFKRLADEVS